jgi:Rieske Fe-S protein
MAALPVTLEDRALAQWGQGPTLIIDHQAQFHPLNYVQRLAEKVSRGSCRIFENSPAIEIDAGNEIVRTEHGTLRAPHIVLATHSPKGFHATQAGMVVHREYGVAVRLGSGACPPGIFWGRGAQRHSVRSVETDDGQLVLVIGEAHKTGLHDAAASLQMLESRARELFDVREVAFRWSAQNYQSPDKLPYIGKDISGCYIATGFATDGLTYGVLAAGLIADEILGVENPTAELFRAKRVAPLKSAKGVAEEVGTMAKSLVRDYMTKREEAECSQLRPGTGALVEVDGRNVAAYRDRAGVLHAVSSICTHLGCKVHWNSVETSWDCACHGSRFNTEGAVIEGPALRPLAGKQFGDLVD